MPDEQTHREWSLVVTCKGCFRRFRLLGDLTRGSSDLGEVYTYVATCSCCQQSGRYHVSVVERYEHPLLPQQTFWHEPEAMPSRAN